MHPWALPRCVNVVGTRCVDGEHAALQRWYADHVHQLMAFDGLLGARLWRCARPLHGQAPAWLCGYDFVSAEAFADYEGSAAKAAAAADRERGWGRDGITIVFRQAFTRLYQRHADDAPAAALQVSCWAQEPDLRRLADTAAPAFEALIAHGAGPARALLLRATAADPTADPTALVWQGRYEPVLQWQR